MARPTKLTPAVTRRICRAIELGVSYAHAASAASVGASTMREWMATNPAFLAAVEAAEGKGVEANFRRIIQQASNGDWRAAAWILEHRFPAIYGQQVTKHEHSGPEGKPLQVEFVNDWRSRATATVGSEGSEG